MGLYRDIYLFPEDRGPFSGVFVLSVGVHWGLNTYMYVYICARIHICIYR